MSHLQGHSWSPWGGPSCAGSGCPEMPRQQRWLPRKCVSAPASLGLPDSSTGLLEALLLGPFRHPLMRPSGLRGGESPMI